MKLTEADIIDIGEQLTADLAWREKEIIALETRLLERDVTKQGEEFDRCRKCLWVMIYAHYEGFFKFALTVYATTLNELQVDCSFVQDRLVAWALNSVFRDLEQGETKHPLFTAGVPKNDAVHRLYRRAEVIRQWRTLETEKLQIPDTAYSTRSNLDYERLQQLLYQAGFDCEVFDAYRGPLGHLVLRRHSIAHGDPENRTMGIQGGEYQAMRSEIFNVMSKFAQMVTKTLSNGGYLVAAKTTIA